MKKSVTLFLTLIFLITAISIVALILTTYKKITSTDFTFISQNSLLIKNIQKTLSNLDKNQTVSYFNKPIIFSSKEGDFRGIIKIKPLCSININDYLENNTTNKNIDILLDYLFFKYNVQDPLLLKDMILDTIDSDSKERMPYSEIKLYKPNFQDGGIYNFKQFQIILKSYANITKDKNPFKIKWKNYFNFTKTQLFKKCTNKLILNLNDENKTNFNIITYDEAKNSFFIKINARYIFKKEHNLHILYDMIKHKVISVENNPVY
jgi:hypothetical protein